MRLLLSFHIILCLFFSSSLYAQKELFDKADAFFGAHLYKDAILSYEKALEQAPEQPLAIARLAESYYMTNNLPKAEIWYEKALTFPSMQSYLFQYAQCLKSNGRLDKAKKIFTEASKIDKEKAAQYASSCDFAEKQAMTVPLFEVKQLSEINSKNADFAPLIFDNKLFFASSRPVAIEKSGQVTWTNDAFNQYYTNDKKVTQLRSFVGRNINDAPMSYDAKADLVAITSNNFMDGIRHIDGSGMLMDIYLYNTKNYNEWDTETEQFFPYNANVNSENPFSTGQPSVSADGTALFFSSNRPGGYGAYDIYVSFRTKSGWSEPRNLGPEINTPGNEMTPFFDGFGNLYFSSDWHHGFGGMDVFVSRQFGESWTTCQNLGKPVNSPFDDLYFVISPQTNIGYFSSNRPGGMGNEDIYEVKLLRTIKPLAKKQLLPGDKIIVTDAFNSTAIFLPQAPDFEPFLESMKADPTKVVQIFVYCDSRGSAQNNLSLSSRQAKNAADYLIAAGISANRIKYEGKGEQFPLNACTDGVTCSEEEHKKNRRTEFIIIGKLDERGQLIREHEPVYTSQAKVQPQINYDNNPNTADPSKITKVLPDVNTPAPPIVEPEPDKQQIVPQKKSHYGVGDLIEVASIFYKPNAANVDEKSPGLLQLFNILNSHKHVRLEIAAHTDAVGDDNYNLELSQRRADELKGYLVNKGIASDRLQAKGYGETQIKNRCKDGVRCSDAEHAVNRRTEFKVIGHIGFKVGDVIKVDHIFYEMNKDVLDMKKSKGLQEIIHILKNNIISVEIRSHTDAKGTAEHNQALSERRAKAVYDYLIANGVNKHRLKYKGYGESMLINRCKDGVNCTDAEHAQNRRTDFKVIGLK